MSRWYRNTVLIFLLLYSFPLFISASFVQYPKSNKIMKKSSINSLFFKQSMIDYLNYNKYDFLNSCTKSTSQSLTLKATQYTIDEPALDRNVLEKTVVKHCTTLDRYLQEKPIAAHTKNAFDILLQDIQNDDSSIILDSGCGTGKSSHHLGQLNPNHTIIGVDKSLIRLNRNSEYRQSSSRIQNQHHQGEDIHSQQSNNVHLLRAELVDFWRLFLNEPCLLERLDEHYILYPNPYPKKKRFQNRWYAHPSFPLLLMLNPSRMVVRSNWKAYLEDFKCAMDIVSVNDQISKRYPCYVTKHGVIERVPANTPAWTNFEQKYDNIGESTFEVSFVREETALS